jgi:hypothetical protein
MKRVALIVGLCALLLPMAAWGSGIDLTNKFGTVTISNAGVASIGSQLWSYGTTTLGHSMGQVNFSTGALTGGSIWTGGTFAGGAGSSFVVTGTGAWAKTLTGASSCGSGCALFKGSFVGPINWTVLSVGKGGFTYTFELSGTVQGQLWNGRMVSGTAHEFIYVYKNQWAQDGKGGISHGNLAIPEPGTLGLLGTGLLGLAGTFRRKLFSA